VSRNKNAVKQDAVKGLPFVDQYSAAWFGGKADREAINAASAFLTWVHYNCTGSDPIENAKLKDQHFGWARDKFLSFVEREYLAAKGWINDGRKHSGPGRGDFFRRLADAVEAVDGKANPARVAFLEIIQDCLKFNKAVPTIPEMHRRLTKAKIDRKTVGRMFELYGVKPGEAKRGPPPGIKQSPRIEH
jgi:hypothetical protein